ncbi:MAG: cytidine deaminase [Deltaproteobacteria bacterium]|nr:cytidine deaminase [Deltaproteobacteria bacterium]
MKLSPKIKKIWKEAVKAQKFAYAPYSKFKVGAAFSSDGKIFAGCNVENASYGATICAERGAVLKALSEGHQKIEDLVVVTPTKKGAPPCALCLQVLSEFADPHLKIWIATSKAIHSQIRLKDLLTVPFLKKDLKNKTQ